ncbi:MAG: diaminopimelate epimerase [Candidatus Omnitrophica bacterium]|nr:diaminopimelate epimerase [Candidatus Omnitrophota bacterium]
MKTLPFYKMVASGNDFVVVDNRRKVVKDPLRFTREVCTPHTGIGADGVLLLENSGRADFKMRIINSDGSEAEACGNGFRCIARYAREILKYPPRFEFESISGLVKAEVKNGTVKVRLPDPKDYRESGDIEVLGHRLHYSFINTGVPHTVIFVEGLEKIDVEKLGSAIRHHKTFKPKGTNVNFVEVRGRSEIEVRTYERGVEGETQACGTGSTASAIISSLAGYTLAPVRVKTRGGETLTISFKKNGKKVTDVFLEGQADFVYEGKIL